MRPTALATREPGIEQLVIIGSGPAAWTAAIYAARAQLAPLVVEGEPAPGMLPGGQLLSTTEVENFPGFPDGITGPELVDRAREQALRFDARAVGELVTAVDFSRRPFHLTTSAGRTIDTRTVIVATGARAIWLGLPNEERLAQSGGGVSACAVCDGALPAYRGQVLAVVGGGDSAVEEALYLTKFAREVVLIHRRDTLRASRIMADRLLAHPNVRVVWGARVTDVIGDDAITGVALEDMGSGARSVLPVAGLFVAIGHTPNTAFLGGQLALDAQGYLALPTAWRTETSVPGVFAAGDVMDPYYRQAITAAGTGAMAALDAERWLAYPDAGRAVTTLAQPTTHTPSLAATADSDTTLLTV